MNLSQKLLQPLRRIGLAKLKREILLQQRRVELALLSHAARRAPRIDGLLSPEDASRISARLRIWVKRSAGLPINNDGAETHHQLWAEISFLLQNAASLAATFQQLSSKRVLYPGQAYYNAWYLSRSLRKRGWVADLLNWDLSEGDQIYYHGEDVRFTQSEPYDLERDLRFYADSIYRYDLFHFSNTHGISFGSAIQYWAQNNFGEHAEIHILKALGKKIAYTNNGCSDGVTRTGFASWGEIPVCNICRWRDNPSVCSDERNSKWGEFRNVVADYQCLLGGNRVDFNVAPTIHEVPEFYCLDPELWCPGLDIPPQYELPQNGTVRLYHAVGNMKERTDENGVNIKSSHIYLPLIDRLQAEGLQLELLSPSGVPNKEVRFIQSQADIFLEMLSYGWFGANVREAMMLGKTVICYIRPEWLDSVRLEIPDYADELPIVSATPETVEEVLRDLIASPEKRADIGKRSRAFAFKWHSAENAAQHFDQIYTNLLLGNPQLLPIYA